MVYIEKNVEVDVELEITEHDVAGWVNTGELNFELLKQFIVEDFKNDILDYNDDDLHHMIWDMNGRAKRRLLKFLEKDNEIQQWKD